MGFHGKLNGKEEKEIVQAFLKTTTGQETTKRLAKLLQDIQGLEKKNQDLEQKCMELNALNKELEEKLEKGGDMLTTQEENIARNLMEGAISVYKSEKPSRYILSVADENGEECRIYSSQVKDILTHLAVDMEGF